MADSVISIQYLKDLFNSQIHDDEKWAFNSVSGSQLGQDCLRCENTCGKPKKRMNLDSFSVIVLQKLLRALGLFGGSIVLMRNYGILSGTFSVQGFPMEGFMGTNSEKLDLTLKLSPCSESEEGKSLGLGLSLSLTRSLSSMAVEKRKKSNVGNGAQEEGPIVACMERSASLPSEDDNGLLRFGDLQAMRRVKTGRRLMLGKRRRVAAAAANGNQFHHGGGGGGGGGGNSNTQRSSNEDANSPVKKLKAVNPHLRDDTMEILRKMPTVTTTGDGPDGRKIKGILYSHEKGEVFIVCVCHAIFLSPAEFVKHAGGKEVENPMKLITVCPNSF
ncbi:unnamed protein product [Lupinus luteus]|uniref:Ninja-family protein n=1 Tax=Lupinus luteus TaxID=3873 RepID=A0AAV1WDR5_LUPLU